MNNRIAYMWNVVTIVAAVLVSAGVARNYARPTGSPVPSGEGVPRDADRVAVSSLGTTRRATAHEAVDPASWRSSLRTISPPELGILEREIGRVPKGKAILIPRGDRTRGHGTHTLAAVWKDHLVRLLHETGRGDAGEGG
jgi:hypothetical protein